jgi:hypothetical protein
MSHGRNLHAREDGSGRDDGPADGSAPPARKGSV